MGIIIQPFGGEVIATETVGGSAAAEEEVLDTDKLLPTCDPWASIEGGRTSDDESAILWMIVFSTERGW